MKLVILFGPCAVGKMTVGQELSKLTGLKLFHNHITIELVSNFFSYGSPEGSRLVHLFRREIFEAVAGSGLPGLIFTFVWALDMREDWEYIRSLHELFASRGAEVYYVELYADQGERLARNRTENRLLHKPTKRNVEWSDENLVKTDAQYRLNSFEGEMPFENFMKPDNTNLSPLEAAEMIAGRFSL